ncbi:MAG: sigma-70 family RNA polymerase sigma factor [Planctomycetes bacterium]|nr:sigma-70 family RNA polymerase sigma factor [Planctomycetota bacterium]
MTEADDDTANGVDAQEPACGSVSDSDGPELLLRRYVDGDNEAFTTLVGLYEERLYVFIHRLVGDAELAEDVFQQTFIKVANKAGGFDNRASFSTWLFRIARNAAIDELRKNKRHVRADDRVDPEIMADANAVQPLARLSVEEQAEQVRQALMLLPEAQREAFLLKEEGDLTFEQVGETLGCGKETAKSRFRLAVDKLRAMLGSELRE